RLVLTFLEEKIQSLSKMKIRIGARKKQNFSSLSQSLFLEIRKKSKMKRKASTESKSAPLEWHEKRSPVEVIPFEDWTRSDIVPELDELHSKILKEVQPDLKYYDYRGK